MAADVKAWNGRPVEEMTVRYPRADGEIVARLPAGRQAAVYARMLGLEDEQCSPAPPKFGHMGIAIVGGYIWPGWSRSREVFSIQGARW